MRYLTIILIILCLSSIATLYLIWPEKNVPQKDIVVTINGYPLTRENIQSQQLKDPHHGDDEDPLGTIITRQLLISEAQRQNIDKEREFRTALKTFYEHSLIKTLMDRMYSTTSVTVSDDEVEKYSSAFGKTFVFYTLKTSREISPQEIKDKGQRVEEVFDNLGQGLQQTLITLTPGQVSSNFFTGNEKYAVLLESVTGQQTQNQSYEKEMLREMLIESKKEIKVNEWIDSLRQQAKITFNTTQE